MQKQGHLVDRRCGALPEQAAGGEQAAHPQLPLPRPGGRPTGESPLNFKPGLTWRLASRMTRHKACLACASSVCTPALVRVRPRNTPCMQHVTACHQASVAFSFSRLTALRLDLCASVLPQDTQQMFDSSMSAAAIAARIQELQAAAGIKAQLVNPAGRGAGIITLTGWVALAALVRLSCQPVSQAHPCSTKPCSRLAPRPSHQPTKAQLLNPSG